MESNSNDQKEIIKVLYVSLCGEIHPQQLDDEVQQQQEQQEQQQNVKKRYAVISVEDWSQKPEEQLINIPDPQNVIRVKQVREENNNIFQNIQEKPLYFSHAYIGETNNSIINLSNQQQQQQQKLEQSFEIQNQNTSQVLLSGGVYQTLDENNQLGYQGNQNMYRMKIYQKKQYEEEEKEDKNDIKKLQAGDDLLLFIEKEQQTLYKVDDFVTQDRLMISHRTGHGSIGLEQGQVLFLNGNSFQEYLNTNESYNIVSGNQQEFNNTSVPRSRACYINFIQGENKNQYVYAFGGFKEFGNNDYEKKLVEKLDVSKGTWENIDIKGLTRPGTGAWGFQHPTSQKIFLLGGIINNKASDLIYLVEDDKNKVKFTKIGQLKVARSNPRGILVKNVQSYQVFVFGSSEEDSFQVEYFTLTDEGQIIDHKIQGIDEVLSKYYISLTNQYFPDCYSFPLTLNSNSN